MSAREYRNLASWLQVTADMLRCVFASVIKDGTQIWIYEIEDSNLDNLIPFIQRKDPENNTHWVDVFRAEKRYRQLKAKLPSMKAELFNMEMVADECL